MTASQRMPPTTVVLKVVSLSGTPAAVATRPAYHCAPLIHQALGTAVQGTVRFSFSQFTTADDVRAAVRALRAIAAM